jgi:tripartite-type tricarboxylate transporter receptor subunit TctC
MLRLLKMLAMSLPLAAVAFDASAGDWPTDKPITIIHAFAPGGDALQRLVAQALEAKLGQTVVFENRPGAGGATGTAYAARQPADGYTLVTAYPGPAANYTNTYKSLPYKPLEDFEHIAQISKSDMSLTVRKDFPAKTLQELINYAKANPGKVTFGNVGIGTYGHMTELALADLTGIEIKLIPYKGSGPLVVDLLSGSVDASIDYLGETYIKQLEAGAIRALAVVSEERVPDYPDVPTFKQSGIDFAAAPWAGIMAPKGTPKEVVDRINAVIGEFLASDGIAEKLKSLGQRPAFTSPEEFHRIVVDEEAKWRDLIKKHGISNE